MNKISALRWLSLVSYFGLLILVLLWNTVINPSKHYPIALILLGTALPLLFPLRGILYAKAYTHAWTSFLALYYFMLGVGDAYSDPEDQVYGILMIVLSTSLFMGCMLYARFKGKEDKQHAADNGSN